MGGHYINEFLTPSCNTRRFVAHDNEQNICEKKKLITKNYMSNCNYKISQNAKVIVHDMDYAILYNTLSIYK